MSNQESQLTEQTQLEFSQGTSTETTEGTEVEVPAFRRILNDAAEVMFEYPSPS